MNASPFHRARKKHATKIYISKYGQKNPIIFLKMYLLFCGLGEGKKKVGSNVCLKEYDNSVEVSPACFHLWAHLDSGELYRYRIFIVFFLHLQ
uniref:Uncharacterized protein n=1 Tax=Pyxicephalus adspersus TaxID=30357 RepID=A0AAV3A804_PYXAD|nr:TPA: hypothetical protein GDO54_016359 [Pyxicephalus adspersus]